MSHSNSSIPAFRKTIWAYYRAHKRPMSWRETKDSYKIFVSEIMLQQTQVSRVQEKYPAFIKAFPSFAALASASPAAVIAAWQGLGYNRRALFLKRSAEIIMRDYRGYLPDDEGKLRQLPGVGPGTAGSLLAFAFNKPSVFIETNIRRVFIHFFFPKKKQVSDEALMPLVAAAVDKRRPREWYWALMDYGSMMKEMGDNPNRRSKHYVKQKAFEGSLRQLRGAVVRALVHTSPMTASGLSKVTGCPDAQMSLALERLCREGFLVKMRGRYQLS